MKVVLDTNILISALLFKGRVAFVFGLIEEEKIVPCFTPSTIKEFQNVLSREKFRKNLEELGMKAEQIVDAILQKSLICLDIKIEDIVLDDPTDNKFLACAVSCNAALIISGDQHLLGLKHFNNLPIITPDKFRKILEKKLEAGH